MSPDAERSDPPVAAAASRRPTSALLAILAAIIALPLFAMLLLMLVRGGPHGGRDIADAVRENRIQAVYMANDAVYFGNLEAGSGDWLRLRDAYFLRASAAEGARDGEEAGVTNLVPVQQQAGGDGNLVLNSREVMLIQNLTADSPIAREIEDANQ